MFTDPQRFVCRNAARRTLFGRSCWLNGDEVRSFAFALVFEQSLERPPRRTGTIAGVTIEFDQTRCVQVLNSDEIVLGGVVGRKLVVKVTAFAFDVSVALRHARSLYLPVGRAVFFARECPLLTFKPGTFDRQIERANCCTIGIVSVLQNPHVDANAVRGFYRWLRWFVIHLDPEDSEPLTGWLFLERDLFDRGGVLRNLQSLMGCTRAVALVNVRNRAVSPEPEVLAANQNLRFW